MRTGFSEGVTTLFRMVIGLLFALHGAGSLFSAFGGSGEVIEFATWPGWWAALIQLVCGGLVLVGLGTRISALLCSGSMAYAYFVVHQPETLLPVNNGGELAAMYCWAFLLIAILGPGRWSVDALFTPRRREDGTNPLAERAQIGIGRMGGAD